MPNDASNVAVGKPKPEGAAFVAPIDTEAPTNPLTALPDTWKCVGYASDAGLTNTQSFESSEIKAWGGDTVVNAQTGYTETYKLKLIECMNPTVLGVVFGEDNVSVSTSGTVVKHTAADRGYMAWCFDVILGDNIKRLVIPEGKVTEVGEVVYVDGEAVGYEVTIFCRPDTDGVTSYEYIAEAGDNKGRSAAGKAAKAIPITEPVAVESAKG